MKSPSPPGLHVVALLIAIVAALFARALIQTKLVESGMPRLQASDFSYIAALPVFILFAAPVIKKDKHFVAQQFRTTDISLRLIVTAIFIGLLFRVVWWSQLIARISFGLMPGESGVTQAEPIFDYQCPPLGIIGLGVLVSAILIPVIEEVVHRGYIQSILRYRRPVVAIGLSTVIFTLFHRVDHWDFAFVAGATLGTMYWLSGSLWAPVITHAIINFTPQLTWRCMNLQWNPSPDSLPLMGPGMVSISLFTASGVGIAWLLFTQFRRRDP